MADDGKGNEAPGAPGIPPSWTSSAKDLVSTALGSSRIWATFGFGVVNEVYWPSTGQPQLRDLGFIIKGPKGWTEVKRARRYLMTTPRACVPLPRFVHEGDDYRLELECLTHPLRDGLLIRYRLEGEGQKLYVLVAPHLGGEQTDNYARAGVELTAQRGNVAMCVCADGGFTRSSAGYVGGSDGWQDFDRNGEMTWTYGQASHGNVALTGELASPSGIIALAFSETPEGARTLARSSLADDYDAVRDLFINGWEDWAKTLELPYIAPELKRVAELSAAVLKIHEDRTYNGAVVASLSVPWGQSRDDLGGYHLVWTRDAVEAALALVAIGKSDDAARVLAYLIGTQGDDGSWAQNYFPSGRGYWTGNQLDEVAMPTMLAAKLKSTGNLVISPPVEEMIHRAIGYIVRNGPMTDQDRWEENAGASPFTLSIAIAAMVAVAEFFDPARRDYILSLADCWNERIESWTYTTSGQFCRSHDVEGYYVRIAPRAADGGLRGKVDVRNRTDGKADAATGLLGLEFLCLVRSGLRRADDPRITQTVRLVDAVLRVETPSGPSYYRYNDDGYGEHADGSPYDGSGIGRLWPLLTGERGHYALAAGEDARPYLEAMSRMTGDGGLIPEQIWDAAPIPELGLQPGKPSGSAMPLVWAHAEFLKLVAAQANGRPTELLDAVQQRWNGVAPAAATWFWRPNSPFRRAPAGRTLLFEDGGAFQLAYTPEGGAQVTAEAVPTQFGMFGVSVPPDTLKGALRLGFTLTRADGSQIAD
ncbi:MAG TPA: glycoside hydrolase family 15 protein, partial [Devosia sp.]|nr:glycoside hydrolase family 15 protein [Devosia sp.]